jgi:hypothetical protein
MMFGEEPQPAGFVDNFSRKWQYLLDKSSPLLIYRWVAFAVVMIIYCSRVYSINGWFIVTYGLGIYLLNQLIGFLSPQFDPEDNDIDLDLPTKDTEEFR